MKKMIRPAYLLTVKTVFLLLACCAFSGTLLAQPLAKGALPAARKALTAGQISSSQITRILTQRVQRTRVDVTRLLPKHKEVLFDEELPASRILRWPSKNLGFTLYPNVAFWDKLSAEDKRSYFLAANNRAIQRLMRERTQAMEQLKRLLPRMWNEKITFDNQPAEKQLVAAIPEQAKYILLGEEHNQQPVQVFVSRVLREYRAAYPDRKIILLTEFLPAGIKKKNSFLQDMKEFAPAYAQVFSTALGSGMQVHGLEPRCMYYDDGQAEVPQANQTKETFDLAILPEAIRLRNKFWLEQIKYFRQQNPDAVFIIYAGAEHLSYSAPFSVGAQLPQQETFSAHVFKAVNKLDKECDFMDLLGDEAYPFYTVKTLSWEDAKLRRAAGFDMRFSVSKKDYSLSKKRKK